MITLTTIAIGKYRLQHAAEVRLINPVTLLVGVGLVRSLKLTKNATATIKVTLTVAAMVRNDKTRGATTQTTFHYPLIQFTA